MGALADGALSAGGPVIGVLPEFMKSLEWGHPGVSDMRVVETMHARKHAMLELADAAVALPGGCGTLEEVLDHYAALFKRAARRFPPPNLPPFVSSDGLVVDRKFVTDEREALLAYLRKL